MTTDELDRILSAADPLEPSAGFTLAVMQAVQTESAEPLPVPFPWVRFAVGLLACGILAATGTVLALRSQATLVALVTPLARALPTAELGYTAMGLFVGLAVARLPRWLPRLRGGDI
jgi:hypothetical protein